MSLSAFLQTFYSKQNITHTDMSGGSYSIPDTGMTEFYKRYKNDLMKGHKFHLTEKQLSNGCIAIDFDFRYGWDIYDKQHIQDELYNEIITLYTTSLKEIVSFTTDTPFYIYFFEKPNINRVEDKQIVKDGIHCIIAIQLSTELCSILRDKVITKIECDHDSMFHTLPLTNGMKDVIDAGVANRSCNWTLYGSNKPDNEAYRLTKSFELTYDDTDTEFVVLDYDIDEPLAKLEQLSVRNPDIPFFQPKIKIQPKKDRPLSPNSVVTIHKPEQNDKYVELLLDVIGNPKKNGTYIIDRQNALKIATALKQNGYDRSVFIQWAGDDITNKQWADDLWDKVGDRPMSIHTLQNIAKNMSDTTAYKQWLSKHEQKEPNYSDKIFNALQGQEIVKTVDEKFFSNLVLNVLKDSIYLNSEYTTVYIYHKNQWRQDSFKQGDIVKCIISDIMEMYPTVCWKKLDYQIEKCDSSEDKERLKKTKDEVYKLKRTLTSVAFCKNLWTQVYQKLKTDNTIAIFDMGKEQHYNIHYTNGVYDKKTRQFRERTKQDHVTMTLPYEYMDYDEIPTEIHDKVETIFKEIHPDQVERDLQLSYLNYSTCGDIGEQKFKVNVGKTAGNGKSTEFAIHKSVFPIYTTELDREVFEKGYTKRHKHMLDLFEKPIRLACVEELQEKRLDCAFIKKLTGGAEQKCEILFGTTTTQVLQAKLIYTSQYDPILDNDAGIKRRLIIQQYTSKFYKPNEKHLMNPEATNEFIATKDIHQLFNDPLYKNAYFHLLNRYDLEIKIPDTMNEAVNEVLHSQDPVMELIEENFIITRNDKDRIGIEDIETIVGNRKSDLYKCFKNRVESMGCKWDRSGKVKMNGTNGIWRGLIKKEIVKQNECLISIEEETI